MKAEALNWCHHHPMGTLIVLVIAAAMLWIGKRILTSGPSVAPSDPAGYTPCVSEHGAFGHFAGGMALLIAGMAFVLWLGGRGAPAHVKVTRPVIRHITHVTHVTQHITQHGTSGWLTAFIAAVIVAVVIWVFRKLIGR